MEEPKIIKIKFDNNKSDNASDSLTTYSLMAVLAGSFFLQVLGLNAKDIFISSLDKAVILIISIISLFLILNAAEITIDIFHFTEINGEAKIQRKYKKQIKYYNQGVVLLITAFIYSFWSYFINKSISYLSAYFTISSSYWLRYLILLITGTISWLFITSKWRKDLKFIKKFVVEVHFPSNTNE